MGSEDPRDMPGGGHESMADARPIHRVYVDGFWMDKTDVTNAEFARFVKATRYVTVAERKPRAEDFPGVPAEKLLMGLPFYGYGWHQVTETDHADPFAAELGPVITRAGPGPDTTGERGLVSDDPPEQRSGVPQPDEREGQRPFRGRPR